MTRPMSWLLSSTLILTAGCVGRESPHFVPSTAGTSGATPDDRQGPSKPSREAPPLTKIQMH
jgi:hypothetical protein